MRILLTGRNGQVGWELERALPQLGEVIATDRAALDLADLDAIRRVVRDVKPEIIVNAAAYTAVDKAESEPEIAMRINGAGPGVLAEEAEQLGALLVHYSTDYVFDGEKPAPYVEEDEPHPLNVYGSTKLAGERAIADVGCRHLILRTSWVYASRGRNFLLTILRLAREKPELRVVDDQAGAPTWAREIARVTARILRRRGAADGVYHVTARGHTSWCGFAREIVRLAGLETPVVPIATADHPTVVRRPANSVLNGDRLRAICGYVLPEWRDSLGACMHEFGPRE